MASKKSSNLLFFIPKWPITYPLIINDKPLLPLFISLGDIKNICPNVVAMGKLCFQPLDVWMKSWMHKKHIYHATKWNVKLGEFPESDPHILDALDQIKLLFLPKLIFVKIAIFFFIGSWNLFNLHMLSWRGLSWRLKGTWINHSDAEALEVFITYNNQIA